MTDFYEELNLDKNASAEEIASELVRLESVWHKREMSRPELAAEKLALIVQAKKVFASDASKAQYDRELNAPAKEDVPVDPNAERVAQFEKWYGEAIQYANTGQADLAKTAIERAMTYGVNEDDASFFFVASQIYRFNGDFSTALGYINRAIVGNIEIAEYHLEKALILDGMSQQAGRYNREDAAAYLNQTRDALREAVSRATSPSENDTRGRALGALAFSLCFRDPSDETQAEQYAQEALRLGDRWNNAQRVLDYLEEQRNAAERAEKEAQARREEAERRRAEAEEEARRREAAAKQRRRREATSGMLAWVLYLVGWAGSLYSIYRVFVQGDGGLQLTTIIVFASAVLLNFGDTFKDGEGSSISLIFSAAYGIAYCFTSATVAYTIMGFSAQSAASTWKFFLIMLAIYFVLMFVARAVGTKANEKSNL